MSAKERLDLDALKAMGADKRLTDAELTEWTGWLIRRYDAHLSNMSCRRLIAAVRERDAEIARLKQELEATQQRYADDASVIDDDAQTIVDMCGDLAEIVNKAEAAKALLDELIDRATQSAEP